MRAVRWCRRWGQRTVLPALVLLGSGCLASQLTTPDIPVYPSGSTRVLFVGNSLTYIEDVPARVVQIARQYGDSSLRTAMIAEADYALLDHWNEGRVQAALARQGWEFVVMQQGPSSLPENQQRLAEWSALFAPRIRAAGATPVLYGVWPTRGRAGDMPAVERSYANAAVAVDGEFAPAGSAWYRALAARPTLPLYAPDGLHASPLGAYLSALVIASRVLGRDPLTLPPVAPGLSLDTTTVRLLQRAASDALVTLDTRLRQSLSADAPATARTAWQRAMTAQQAGAIDSALSAAREASDAWPVQPAYTQGVLRLATQLGDTVTAAHARRRLVRQRALTRASSPAARARSVAVVLAADTTVFPEGLAADARSGTLYVSSLAHRAVYAHDTARGWRVLVGGATSPELSPVAIVVDTSRRLLVAATGAVSEAGTPPVGALPALLFVRLADGQLSHRVALPERLVPGEITMLPNGDVVISDAVGGALVHWRRDTDRVTRLTHPWLRSPQGLVASRDGMAVYVADWSTGLLRVSLADGTAVRLAEPQGATLVGLDGLMGVGDALIGVQNGLTPARIVRIALSADGTAIREIRELDRPASLPGEATVGTLVGDAYWYVASSHWPFRDSQGRRVHPERPLPPVELRRLTLPAR